MKTQNDPKYTPTDKGFLHPDGYLVPADEPCMLFRGKDIGSLIALSAYVEMLIQQPLNDTILSHLISSTERLAAFIKYQLDNPELQSVGCSKRNHNMHEWFLDKAKVSLAVAQKKIDRFSDLLKDVDSKE